MGEPRAGDFPDPIYTKTAHVELGAHPAGKSGDYLKFDKITDDWTLLTDTNILDNEVIGGGGIAQIQHDVAASTIPKAVVASVFTLGSWFYGIANTVLNSNDYVFLTKVGGVFGFSSVTPALPITILATAVNNIVTLNVAVPGGSETKIGDEIIMAGQVPVLYSGRFPVVSKNSFSISVLNHSASGPVTTPGTFQIMADAAGAHAQFVKVSGDTSKRNAAVGDVCIFTMLSGGMRNNSQ